MIDLTPPILRNLNRTVRLRLTGSSLFPEVPSRKPTDLEQNRWTDGFDYKNQKSLKTSVRKAKDYLFSLQTEEGFFEGHVFDNITITSEYVMFLSFLDLLDTQTAEKAREEILSQQNEDGGWSLFYGGPSEHSATVEAYFALKLLGLNARNPSLRKARTIILKRGGIETTRVFTKIHLALFGEYPWSRIPTINPELMLMPKQSPIHIYEFSSWSRAVIIPLLIIFDQKPVKKLRLSQRVSELYVPGTKITTGKRLKGFLKNRKWDLERIFEVVQGVLAVYEKIPVKPLRSKALVMAEKWILDHQDPTGNWGGIFPAMANSILALHLRGYPLDHPALEKGLSHLRAFGDEREKTLRIQSTRSPVWDTAIASYALQEAGIPFTEKRIQETVEWLLRMQILDVKGDWAFKAETTRPGGWPFEHENNQYPDIDDSALAILALLRSEMRAEVNPKLLTSIERGIEWIIGMQGSDGGWGAFDRDNNRQILNQIPFADLKSLLDPSTPDVTGHVIEALGAAGIEFESQPIQRAVRFLKNTQERDGSWFGRWGVNYVYGTSAVLSGLNLAGEDMRSTYVSHARDFLLKIQNDDGGWGESCDSYEVNRYLPLHYSTASQTAWALLGLLACPDSDPEAISEGIDFLIRTQKEDGSWEEPEWTGTGFPRHFYLRYDYYRLYFPLMALGRALRCGKMSTNQKKAVAAA